MNEVLALDTKEISVTQEQIELIRRTVANGATQDELQLFLFDCKRQGVHPLDKLLHFTKRGGKYTPITSIDFMRSRADATGEYAGNDDPAFVEGTPYPEKASVTVWKIVQTQRVPFSATARWVEYFPGDQQGFMWKKMPHVMLGKVAEALALRKAFPRQLSGLYASEEMDQAARTERLPEPAAPAGLTPSAPPPQEPKRGPGRPPKVKLVDQPHDLQPAAPPPIDPDMGTFDANPEAPLMTKPTEKEIYRLIVAVNEKRGIGQAQRKIAELMHHGRPLNQWTEAEALTVVSELESLAV